MPICSGGLVEAVAEKYNCRKDSADCHTYNKCKYIARKEHSEPPVFYLVGSANPMPIKRKAPTDQSSERPMGAKMTPARAHSLLGSGHRQERIPVRENFTTTNVDATIKKRGSCPALRFNKEIVFQFAHTYGGHL